MEKTKNVEQTEKSCEFSDRCGSHTPETMAIHDGGPMPSSCVRKIFDQDREDSCLVYSCLAKNPSFDSDYFP